MTASMRPMIALAREGPVAVLTLDRPEARNALCREMLAALDAALDELDTDTEARSIVLTGAGGDFAAGADIGEMLPMTTAEVVLDDFAGCSRRLPSVGKPVVAAVGGWALGGGCELVEMCDVVIAAETARFGHPEITVGTMPGAGGTQRLTRALGKAKAMDLLMTGRTMTAEEAERCGLVSRVVPAARLIDEAIGVAARIASFSAPLIRMIKDSVGRAHRVALDEGLAYERRSFHLTFALEDRREGMNAFVGKRAPVWRDR